MSQPITHPQLAEVLLDRKPTADLNSSVAEKPRPTLSNGETLPLPVPLELANSWEARLACELQLVQFILSESEAAFTSPVHHFFTPGGQQLQYNQN